MGTQSLSSGRKDQDAAEAASVPRGKSLLVAAIMDLVTTNCDTGDQATCFRPMLPGEHININQVVNVWELFNSFPHF